MPLSEPFDILPSFPGWTTVFDLAYRQEQSVSGDGTTYVKDMGPPLWVTKAESRALSPNELDYWRAVLKKLENGLFSFYGYPLSRTYPILYPKGSWPTGTSFDGTTASLYSVNSNRKAIKLNNLPQGYKGSVGDYVSLEGDLHQVMEDFTADVSSVTTEFEVRPHLWPGVTAASSPPTLASVKRPHCLMKIVPGSLSTPGSLGGWGTVSFDAKESR